MRSIVTRVANERRSEIVWKRCVPSLLLQGLDSTDGGYHCFEVVADGAVSRTQSGKLPM